MDFQGIGARFSAPASVFIVSFLLVLCLIGIVIDHKLSRRELFLPDGKQSTPLREHLKNRLVASLFILSILGIATWSELRGILIYSLEMLRLGCSAFFVEASPRAVRMLLLYGALGLAAGYNMGPHQARYVNPIPFRYLPFAFLSKIITDLNIVAVMFVFIFYGYNSAAVIALIVYSWVAWVFARLERIFQAHIIDVDKSVVHRARLKITLARLVLQSVKDVRRFFDSMDSYWVFRFLSCIPLALWILFEAV